MSNDLNIKYLENYLEKRINDEYDRKYRVNICKLYHVSDNKFEIYVRPSHSDTDDSIVGYEILRDILIEDGMLEKEGEKYQADTGDTLNVDSDVDFIKVNSRDNGYEDLVIDNTGARIQFCKTARQEYTLIVKAILLIAQKYDYVYDLSCDDSYDTSHKSWDAAKEFVKKYNLLIFN